ncbi:MAG: adenylate/guanylate cyclase domain-containing protein, partial [Oleibacter sp.]|nr:adenylate/guanylate cyclase domain-containing protein [Thalassolituus sp.]
MHCLYAARLFTGLVEHMRNHQTDLLPLEFNIAAHFGPVLMAPMQDELSTQYSIIGDTVHWASNLASHSEERRIVVSQVMVENMEHGHDVIWREGPTVKDLHGGEQRTYWLDSLPENNERLVQRQIQHITSMTESA